MKELKERILKEGRVLPGDIIKVDGFLNHRVDCELMSHIADEFAKYFNIDDIDILLTAEASGIALTAVCALRYGKPMVYAKKAKSDNIEGGLYQSDIFSYTYKKKVTLLVAQDWISASDRVLIVDDFMANGEAMRGLLDIVAKSGAQLAGIGVAVEKGFQHGGDRLREAGYDLHSLAIIESAEDGVITFRGDQCSAPHPGGPPPGFFLPDRSGDRPGRDGAAPRRFAPARRRSGIQSPLPGAGR